VHNKKHSAVFPEVLPEWFIKLFTKEGIGCLIHSSDPAPRRWWRNVNRHSIGIELMDVYYQRACVRVGKTPALSLADPGVWTPRGGNISIFEHQVPCVPCSLAACPVESHPCMDAISPAPSFNSILATLDR
jgi:hypothetical protein